MQHHQIQAITWSDVIQWNASQPSLQRVSVLSSCDSFRTNSFWCSNVNKMSDQPVWWGLWVAIDKAAAEDSGSVSAPRGGDTKWSQHFGRPRRQRRLQLCLNSYILYEFVIESLIMLIKDILGPTFLYPILCTIQETSLKTALHRITSTHSNELFY